jgi:hypothetical protein
MASLPADEDYARALLWVFHAKKIRVQQSLRVADARASFLVLNMGRLADFEAALDHAIKRGWLNLAFDMARLTPKGLEEIRTMSVFT